VQATRNSIRRATVPLAIASLFIVMVSLEVVYGAHHPEDQPASISVCLHEETNLGMQCTPLPTGGGIDCHPAQVTRCTQFGTQLCTRWNTKYTFTHVPYKTCAEYK